MEKLFWKSNKKPIMKKVFWKNNKKKTTNKKIILFLGSNTVARNKAKAHLELGYSGVFSTKLMLIYLSLMLEHQACFDIHLGGKILKF